jgi:hypothetical protein
MSKLFQIVQEQMGSSGALEKTHLWQIVVNKQKYSHFSDIFFNNDPEQLHLNNASLESFVTTTVDDQDKKFFQCGICVFKSYRKEHVKSHLKSVHTPHEKIRCTTCGSTHKNSRAFREHLRTFNHKQKACNMFSQ